MRDATLALLLLHGTAAVVMPRSRSVVCRMPSLAPLPPALAASDGVHTFTYDSVQCATQRSNPRLADPRLADPRLPYATQRSNPRRANPRLADTK